MGLQVICGANTGQASPNKEHVNTLISLMFNCVLHQAVDPCPAGPLYHDEIVPRLAFGWLDWRNPLTAIAKGARLVKFAT